MDRRALLALAGSQAALSACGRFQTEPDDVSLIRLIANPEKFHGRSVRTEGFLRLEFEGDALYVSKQDYDGFVSKNAVWVSVPQSLDGEARRNLTDRYVRIEGKFNAKGQGHMGLFSGAIEQVGRISPIR